MRRRQFIKILGASIAAANIVACADEPAMPGPVINTDRGKVKGSIVDGVHRFLGIPYAEAPFGKRRFIPAVPREKWQGTFDASQDGLICPQTGVSSSETEGEDCLNLNIWTPDPFAKGLPVMVWAHGGGQTSGSGSNGTYDGSQFAKEGVVLITCNRRIGAEGYLYLQEQFGDGIGPGNLGILDQIEVLRWVQRNAEQFGGNPNNVTLFGESGGGATTQAVAATTTSTGLFHRAIVQSGGHAAQRPDTANAIAEKALQLLGIRPGDIDALRQTPWPKFVEIYEELQKTPHGRPQIYLPVLGETMPNHPVDAAGFGAGADVDYLIGTCRDEMNLFNAFPGDKALAPFRRQQKIIRGAVDIDMAALKQAYLSQRPELDDEAVDLAILGDMWFRIPGIRIADDHAAQKRGRTYMYLFTWESQFLGAAHAMDLLMFGNGLPLPGMAGWSDYDKVSQHMRKSWVNFARTGNPSTTEFKWNEYDLENRWTTAINDEFSLLKDPYREQRDVVSELFNMSWKDRGV